MRDPSSPPESPAVSEVLSGAADPVRAQRSLWSRIKEHKLIQATLAYCAVALAIAHGEELIANAYQWPQLVSRIMIGALGVGLPLTLVTIWLATRQRTPLQRAAFGRTLDRVLLLILALIIVALVAERVVGSAHAAPNQLNRFVILALGLLVVALLADRLVFARTASQRTSTDMPAHRDALSTARIPAAIQAPSIAVLPFSNLSSDKEQEYFSDGLSEELINHLAHIKGLRVLSRTSSFAFKGKSEDLRMIGEKLSVGSVLEGSVRKAGNRLRITAQLVDCADGYHLWSETFDRELDDVFAIQNDISRAVAQALGVALGVGEGVPTGGTRNLEAYDLCLRARALTIQFGPNTMTRGAELYREALALDPGYGDAWAGLAVALTLIVGYYGTRSAEAMAEWVHAVQRAVTLAPELWRSQMVLGTLHGFQRHWVSAEQACRKAVELAPQCEASPARFLAVRLLDLGQCEEAITLLLRCRKTEPLSHPTSSFLQLALTIASRDAEVEIEYRRGRDLNGDRELAELLAWQRAVTRHESPTAIRQQMEQYLRHASISIPVLSELLDLLDQPEVARERLRQVSDDAAYQDSYRQRRIALLAAQFGDVDLAMSVLRRAFVEMGGSTAFLWLPILAELRKDRRFKDLLLELKIVDYWRATGKWGDFARPLGAGEFEVL